MENKINKLVLKYGIRNPPFFPKLSGIRIRNFSEDSLDSFKKSKPEIHDILVKILNFVYRFSFAVSPDFVGDAIPD